MQHTYDERGSGFLMGLLCGAAVGAAAGLLFAPRTGAGMRAQVSDTASKVGQRAKDTYQRASGAVSDLRTRAEDLSERFKQRATDAADRVGDQIASADSLNRMDS